MLASMNVLHWTALAALLTGLFWLPYVAERMLRHGLGALGNPPKDGLEAAPWANRARAAHANASENLGVFAALAIVAYLSGHGESPLALFAAQAYVVARMAHYIIYAVGVTGLRTLAFAGGFVAQVLLAFEVLR